MERLRLQNPNLWLALAAVFVLSSCDGETVSCKSVDVPLDGWASEDTLYMEYHVTESPNPHSWIERERNYALELSARYSGQYPYTEIPVTVGLLRADSLGYYQLQDSLLQVRFVTVDEEGRRVGDYWGSLYAVDWGGTHIVRFPEAGDYRIALAPDTFLVGVASITATLTETDRE